MEGSLYPPTLTHIYTHTHTHGSNHTLFLPVITLLPLLNPQATTNTAAAFPGEQPRGKKVGVRRKERGQTSVSEADSGWQRRENGKAGGVTVKRRLGDRLE